MCLLLLAGSSSALVVRHVTIRHIRSDDEDREELKKEDDMAGIMLVLLAVGVWYTVYWDVPQFWTGYAARLMWALFVMQTASIVSLMWRKGRLGKH